ncbi:MAG: hypothetical protein KAU07_02305 [Candidatus Andersenbacteria bacterium]|nr:hypothetical protein [Candidatus Andersenbacteria bacterium]
MTKVVARRKFNTKKADKTPEYVNLENSNAEQVLFMFSLPHFRDVPYGLREEEDDSADYMRHRADEVAKGGMDIDHIEVQRPIGSDTKEIVVDTGFEMAEFPYCEGGITVFNQFLNKGWKVDDAHWKVKKSQQGIKSGKGRKKYQVVISLSREGKEAKLSDATCKGILRLLHMTWAVHAWDNRHLPQKNVVLNFPLCRGFKVNPKHVFVL